MKSQGGEELTRDEVNAVRAMRRVANRFPPGLGIFSWSGRLYIVKLDERGGMPDCIECAIVGEYLPITNDGGDPDNCHVVGHRAEHGEDPGDDQTSYDYEVDDA